MSIKVSIIIPVYNVEKYLKESMDSAVNQTIREIEIIAVNDGSTDNSVNILSEYKEKYDNIKIINQENRGLSGARNTGIRASRGEYIYFLDSDDYIALDAMEKCYNYCKKNDLDIVAFDAHVFIDGDFKGVARDEEYSREKKLKSLPETGENYYNTLLKNRAYKTSVCLNVYKREFLLNNNLYFYEGIIHEDELFCIKSILLAEKVMYIPQKHFYRRIRSNSIITTKVSDKNAKGYLITANEVNALYSNTKYKFNEKTIDNLLKHIRKFYSISLSYCDELNKNEQCTLEQRKEIIKAIKSNKEVPNTNLKVQINRPKLYYIIMKIIKNIKKQIKKILNTLRG